MSRSAHAIVRTAVQRPLRLRSGAAARLAGLPVTTLRVWERRYGVVAAPKGEGGQREYTHRDVSRLRLLRQLTRSGHAIGTIARLELDDLQTLANDTPGASAPRPDAARTAQPASREVRAVVVGRALSAEVEMLPGCAIRSVHDDIDAAELGASTGGAAELLLLRLASLQPETVGRVLALARTLGAGAVLVVYRFGTAASVRALNDAGATVRREPWAEGELAAWVRRAVAAVEPTALLHEEEPRWPIAPRAFSDATLAHLAAMPSPVSCECLRHMAEIVSQLAAFERYSRECVSAGPADAALHRQLSRTAGAARTIFERALQRVVNDERLAPDDDGGV